MNYAMKYELFAEVCGISHHSTVVYTNELQKKNYYWENTNKLLNKYFIGGKTGITASAGPCLVSHFKFGSYESQGVIIDSKSADVRWKEMATLLLWQFDKFLKKNSIAAYNKKMV